MCQLCCGLQVGTQDGRVLVFGQEGVEQTLPSQATVGTTALFFLANKDSLLRVTSVRPCGWHAACPVQDS